MTRSPGGPGLDERWETIRVLERLPRRSGQLGLAARVDRDAARARATLAPLRRWERISAASFGTYVNDANVARMGRMLDFVHDGDRVLDVGTGFGYVAGVLLRERRLAHYVGIDVKEQLRDAVLDMLAVNGLADRGAELEVMDVNALTPGWMARHRPDVALVLEVLEHLVDPGAALRALSAALPEQATVLFTVPILGRLEGVWGHASLFDRERVEAICGEADLRIHHVEPVHATWTLVAAARGGEVPARVRSAAPAAPRLTWAKRRLARRLRDPPPSAHTVTPVTIDGYQDFSRPGDDPARVRLEHRLTGVFCRVDGDGTVDRAGGVRLPVAAPRLLRLQLTCDDPDAFEEVAVVGVAADGAEVLRWTWHGRRDAITDRPTTHVLRAGRSSRHFRAERAEAPERVVAVDVVARARAGATAAFRVHRVAYFAAAPQGPAAEPGP